MKTVHGSWVRYAYRSLPWFDGMFTGLGGKVALSCDLNMYVGLYVCSDGKAGIAVSKEVQAVV